MKISPHIKTIKLPKNTNELDVSSILYSIGKLEKIGDYQSALSLLDPIWRDKSNVPDVSEFTQSISAEILLRCGAIIGYVGNLQQFPDAQKLAQNILTIARTAFIRLYDSEKVAECENHLASAFYRSGEYKEAQIYISTALFHNLDRRSNVRLHSHVIKTVILLAEKHNQETIIYLEKVEEDFKGADALFAGSYATNLGLAYKNLGNLDVALKFLKTAKQHHLKSGHLSYLGTTENNLAQVYRLRGKYQKATESADSAIRLFQAISDHARMASANETKAQIFIDWAKYDRAVYFANEAIDILKFSDNAGLLCDVFLTKSIALTRSDKVTEAILAVHESMKFAQCSGSDRVMRVAESFAQIIKGEYPSPIVTYFEAKNTKLSKTGADDVRLDLPPEITSCEVFGVWIENDFFEKLGLAVGNLAIGIYEEPKPGNLVAVESLSNGDTLIGFYDSAFGVICLENYITDPEIFDKKEIRMIGKIVGYCEPIKNEKDRYTVKILKQLEENGTN